MGVDSASAQDEGARDKTVGCGTNRDARLPMRVLERCVWYKHKHETLALTVAANVVQRADRNEVC
jgi:hypothetical protein